MKTLKIKSLNASDRLDQFLTAKLKVSRSQIQKLIKSGGVLVNGKPIAPHYFLKEADTVTVNPANNKYQISTDGKTDQSPTHLLLKLKPTIVAKTPDYLVVEKPAGLPVHPDSHYLTGTLIQQLVKKYPEIAKVGDPSRLGRAEAGDKDRPGIVHRLDKDASGLLVVARTRKMFQHLKAQFQNREIKKEYWTLVRGRLTPETAKINFPISRGADGRMIARAVGQPGKLASSEYSVEKYFINYSLAKVVIHTGRTHQIRVHLQALGHPVAGDALYFIKKQKPDKTTPPRLFLHSTTLGFTDLTGQYQEFHSDLPAELKEYLTKIK
ncbi:MAG: RluA family pseudouridine synthase [Patescibacteria group bacterium]|jgi:23S rRNA pseudouridine1911/1915/1917 synthase